MLEGVGDLMWGANVKELNIGLPEGPSEYIDTTDMFIEKLEISASCGCGYIAVSLTLFHNTLRWKSITSFKRWIIKPHYQSEFRWKQLWIVWSVSGLVALVAGVMWGAKSDIF